MVTFILSTILERKCFNAELQRRAELWKVLSSVVFTKSIIFQLATVYPIGILARMVTSTGTSIPENPLGMKKTVENTSLYKATGGRNRQIWMTSCS